MAIISKSTISFNGRSFHRVLKVNSEGEFSIALPQVVQEALGKEEATGKTKDAAEDAFKKALNEFHLMKQVKRKVLAVKFETQEEKHWCHGMELSIVVAGYEETKSLNAEGEATYHYEHLRPSDYGLPKTLTDSGRDEFRAGGTRSEELGTGDKYAVIPLTGEAVAFLVELEINLLKLQGNLQRFLGGSKVLQAAIATGLQQALLPPPDQKKAKKK